MSISCVRRGQRQSSERGSIIVMTALLMALLFVMVGLCIDVSRIYMVRAELQNAADSAALTAARELNSGTAGIDDAVARANAIANTYGFAKTGVSIASVQFAANLNDNPYMSAAAAKANPAAIRFVKVTTQSTTTSIIFAIGALGSSRAQVREAVAGMSVGLNTICDFYPAAVVLSNPNPAPGTLINLNFAQGSGNSATVADKDYIALEVPGIPGNGQPETTRLAAGLPNYCQSFSSATLEATPSANKPKNQARGTNTRFNIYANGPGQLNPTDFPPDSNVQQGITNADYKNRAPGKVTAPNPNAPGKDNRRLVVAPIIAPGTYFGQHPQVPLGNWGVFFIKNVVDPSDGILYTEYVGDAVVIGSGSYDPNSPSSSLRIAVLYR